MTLRALLPAGLGLTLLCAGASADPMRVTTDHVNIRSGPGTRYEIMGQVSAGDVVTVRRTVDEWAEIAAPPGAGLWLYAELLDGSTVAANGVQIRSGPGISYRAVGKLDTGRQVSIEETSGDWVRIAPLEEASAWISRQFLEAPTAAAKPAAAVVPEPVRAQPAPPAVAPPAPPVAAVKQVRPLPPPPAAADPALPASPVRPPVASPAPAPARVEARMDLPVALVGRPLAEDKDQGTFVELTGDIQPSGWAWGKLSPYRLVGPNARGRTVTICYVLGNAEQLASLVGRRVAIEGRQYWVRRVRYPGVSPERIRVQR